MLRIVFCFLLLTYPFFVTGQRNTYTGKTVALKIPVINNTSLGFNAIEAELIATRSISFSVGYGFGKQHYTVDYDPQKVMNWVHTAPHHLLQEFYGSEQIDRLIFFQNTPDYPFYPAPIVADINNQNGNFSGSTLSQRRSSLLFSARVYLNRASMLAAPYGWYMELSYERGKQTISGELQLPAIIDAHTQNESLLYRIYTYGESPAIKSPIKEAGLRFSSYALSIGFQNIYTRFLFDVQMGLSAYGYRPKDTIAGLVASHMEHSKNLFMRESVENTTLGFQILVKAGILLY